MQGSLLALCHQARNSSSLTVVNVPTSVVNLTYHFWLNSPIKPTLITDRQPHSSLTRVTFDRSERYGVGTVVLAEPWVVTKQLDPVCLLGSADVIGMGHYPLPARFFMLALSCMSDVEP